MRQNFVETVLGAVVLVVAAGFLYWAYTRSHASEGGGYELTAQFDRADGLEVGSDVRISGIKVGSVVATRLDPQSYRAEVRFSVAPQVELPRDSSAAITSASLLGGKYLSLVPGGDVDLLRNGDEVTLTQSSINLEELVGRYIFGTGGGATAPGSGAGAAAPPAGAAPQ